MQGWIKLHRQLLEWEWYDDVNTFRLFIHLILKASHKERKYKGVTIKIGQVMTGRKILSMETGLSEQKIRTSLERLKSTNEITIESSSQGTIIQLVNYEKYQVATDGSTNDQPTINQQVTTNKNVKNEKNEIFISRAVEYFNRITGKKFNPDSKVTIKLINKLIDDGMTKEDFKKVIDFKHKQWRDDPKMKQYIKPSTLFANDNFHKYLDEANNDTKEATFTNDPNSGQFC